MKRFCQTGIVRLYYCAVLCSYTYVVALPFNFCNLTSVFILCFIFLPKWRIWLGQFGTGHVVTAGARGCAGLWWWSPMSKSCMRDWTECKKKISFLCNGNISPCYLCKCKTKLSVWEFDKGYCFGDSLVRQTNIAAQLEFFIKQMTRNCRKSHLYSPF